MKNKFCGECGANLPENAKFCGECGTAISSAATHKAPVYEKDGPVAGTKSTSPKKDIPSESNSGVFNAKAVVSWSLIWAGIWLSLYLVRILPYFEYINFPWLASYLAAGLLGGIAAGVVLQQFDLARQSPTLGILKKPLLYWLLCWGVLAGVKILVYVVDSVGLYRILNFALPTAAVLYGAWLIWEVLPHLTNNLPNSFTEKRKNAAIYCGAIGLLAVFVQKGALSLFIGY